MAVFGSHQLTKLQRAIETRCFADVLLMTSKSSHSNMPTCSFLGRKHISLQVPSLDMIPEVIASQLMSVAEHASTQGCTPSRNLRSQHLSKACIRHQRRAMAATIPTSYVLGVTQEKQYRLPPWSGLRSEMQEFREGRNTADMKQSRPISQQAGYLLQEHLATNRGRRRQRKAS